MEERLRVVEIQQAVQAAQVSALTMAVMDNTQAVKDLTAMVNRGKGGWWVVLTAASIVTFLSGLIIAAASYFRG